jgi:signal transduction histidine kinase
VITALKRWGDPVVGVLAAALSIAVLIGGEYREGAVWANVAVYVVYGGLLAARSRAPVPTAFAFAGVLVVLSALLTPPPRNVAIFFGLLLFAYSAGTWPNARLRRAYGLVLLGGIAAANLALEDSSAGDWIFPSAMAIAAYIAGRNAVYRSALAAELIDAATRAELDHDEEERSAVAAERRRIAREMHDVVAHSISVMVVQAGGARRILARDAARAEQAAAQIERTGRETLTEMRRLLGVMHGGLEPAELQPSPTLDDLGALCRRCGARLTVEGEPRAIAAGLAIGAYRVVQEALDDSRRTVPGSEPAVDVTWTDTALELSISDDRPYAGPVLPGVRERVALYEGELQAGPRNEGDGHRLVVSFPLQNDNDAVPLPGA